MAMVAWLRKRLRVVALVAVLIGVIVWWRVRDHRRRHLDGDTWLAEATEEARDWRSDAQLVRFEASAVGPDAKSLHVKWLFEFGSPSLGTTSAPSVVPGAPAPPPSERCFIYSVSLRSGVRGPQSVSTSGDTSSNCAPIVPTTPVHCSIKQVWARARAAGAPVPAYADIELTTKNGVRTWRFEIVDRAKGTTLFKLDVPDDC
jgi:hypothetical protein